jgi:chromosome segregation ATPase
MEKFNPEDFKISVPTRNPEDAIFIEKARKHKLLSQQEINKFYLPNELKKLVMKKERIEEERLKLKTKIQDLETKNEVGGELYNTRQEFSILTGDLERAKDAISNLITNDRSLAKKYVKYTNKKSDIDNIISPRDPRWN